MVLLLTPVESSAQDLCKCVKSLDFLKCRTNFQTKLLFNMLNLFFLPRYILMLLKGKKPYYLFIFSFCLQSPS